MRFVRNLFTAFVLVVSTSAFAVEQNVDDMGQDARIEDMDLDPLHEVYWLCSAHNSHDPHGHEIYYGHMSSRRREAAWSAIQICEYNEGHQCTLHECHSH